MIPAAPPKASASLPRASVSLVDDADALARLTPAWERMVEEGASGASPLNDPRVIAATLASQPALAPRLAVVRRGERIVCVAPFYVQDGRFPLSFSVWRVAAPKARLLRLFGEEVVFAPDADRQESLDLVFGAIQQRRRDFDFVWIDGLRQEEELAAVGASLPAAAARCGMETFVLRREVNHRVRLAATADEYAATLGSSTRQNLRRSMRRFFEASDARFAVVSTVEETPRLLEWMAQIDANSWQGKTFARPNRVGGAYGRLVEAVAERGWLRSYVLLKGDEPVAFEHGFLHNGTYFGQECAYDSRWSSAGPGSLVIFHALQDLITSCGARLVDFGVGEAPYKRSFGNETRVADVICCTRRGGWRRLVAAQKLLEVAERRGRQALTATGLDRVVRKWVKHKA